MRREKKDNKDSLTAKILRIFLRCFVLVFLCLCVFVSLCLAAEEQPTICFQQHCFTIELADTPEKWMQGLMFRDSMPEDHGMLFVFDHDEKYSFWMKNTLIPLDIIWLDQDLKVVHVEKNVLPCQEDACPSYTAPIAARYVLELNAGVFENIGLMTGAELILK